MDKIITILIKRNPPPLIKLLIFFNHSFLIENYTEDFLEENKIFTFCFDTTSIDKIENMRDYNEVLKVFPGSLRVAHKSFHIGNYRKEDWLNIIGQYLSIWFPEGYEIIVMEGGFTNVF